MMLEQWIDAVAGSAAPSAVPGLAAVLVELAPLGDTRAEDIAGHHVHGWFFESLQGLDAARATDLHQAHRRKPFTLWAGRRFALDPGGITCDPTDRRVWLRITLLDPLLLPLVHRLLASRADVSFGGSVFRVSNIIADGRAHPWTAVSSYAELWSNSMTGPNPSGHVLFRFLTPTAFAGTEATVLFPLPHLVFTNLLRRWNAHSGHALEMRVQELLLRLVREEAHEIRSTPPQQFGRYFVRGFIGTCEYSVGPRAPDDVSRALRLLADFAFFSGVGLKTTMGMGQVLGEPI